MFGKSKKKETQKEEVVGGDKKTVQHVHVMPDIFYGGKDPEYYHQKDGGSLGATSLITEEQPTKEPKKIPEVPKVEEEENIEEEVQKEQEKTPEPSGDVEIIRPKGLGRNAQILIIVLCACAVLGGVLWFILAAPKGTNQEDEKPKEAPVFVDDEFGDEPVGLEPVFDTDDLVATTTTSTVPAEPIEEPEESKTTLDFPRMIFSKASDIDADKLTDIEEELFGTDSGTWDTDGDGY